MIVRVLCALGLLGMALVPAQAADQADKKQAKADPAALFKKLDTNNDGKLSKEELKAGPIKAEKADKVFDKLDTNKDGSLNADELKVLAARKAGGRVNPAELFKKLDINSDGKLSKEEVGKAPLVQDNAKRLDKVMQRLDTNNDGFLNEEEFKKLAELRKK